MHGASIFAPAGAPADAILTVALLVLAIAAAVFLLVGGLLVFCIVRYRHRPGDESEPPQVYGSNQVELAWTVVPILIVLVLITTGTRTTYEIQAAIPPPDAVRVRVVGHQWWWEFEYPDLGVVTANELHIPVRTMAYLILESADVVHSFWVPRLGGKTDVIPNRRNTMWLTPAEPGLFIGQCAEYCGTQHAHMLLRVVVHPPGEFESWVAAQRLPAAANPVVAAGRQVFEQTACVNCHTVRGTGAAGRFGPDLTHLMSRQTLGAGVAPLDPTTLRAWIADPDHLKPGVLMPAMQLDDPELDQVVAYLATLR